MSGDAESIRAEILRLTRKYSRLQHRGNRPAGDQLREPFDPVTSTVPYAGRVFTEDEVEAAVSAALDFWLTLGPEGEAFEREFASFLGVRYSILVNSGSSANLLAVNALTSPKVPAARRLMPGDEVITVAAGFPTTVAPIIQCGAVPVFIDNDPATGNVRADQLEAAYVAGKTKAVILAHTLGNPFDLGAVLEFCHRYELWLIEDNCDSLGSTYSMPEARARRLGLNHLLMIAENGDHPLIRFETLPGGADAAETAPTSVGRPPPNADRLLTAPTGVWGDLSTQSFYPPHHLTMGEGGAVNVVRRPQFKAIVESFRDWGRDCWCASGRDNTCGKRFEWQLGELPEGYDHKYIYSHLGYNLKPMDVQAAIGRRQLRKLPAFVEARKHNWEVLRAGLADLEEFFEFSLPMHARAWTRPMAKAGDQGPAFAWDDSGCRSNPSWFGFMLLVRPTAPFTRTELARHLDMNKVGNRMLFGGNLIRQPAFVRLAKDRPRAFRVAGSLSGADCIMQRSLFLGTYPGIDQKACEQICRTISSFLSRH